jgi:hypothetical protein
MQQFSPRVLTLGWSLLRIECLSLFELRFSALSGVARSRDFYQHSANDGKCRAFPAVDQNSCDFTALFGVLGAFRHVNGGYSRRQFRNLESPAIPRKCLWK